MKLAILSCGPNAYSTRRLKEAAEQRDHQVKILNTLKFAIDLDRGSPDLYYRQKALSHYDAVLPRIGASITYYGTAVVRQFQEMNVFCANTAPRHPELTRQAAQPAAPESTPCGDSENHLCPR
tara:strand:- start:8961 stop:9329 length:369 start_codon:yes stop_codon:yes gene_type:complete